MASEPTISVAVCTLNRADMLRRVLEDLCAQTADPERYEVLVVDNGSSDDTAQVARRMAREHGNVRYVLEERTGLSHARNRAWREARGRYVGYVDDDCRVPPHWVEAALELIEERRPAALGGPYYPFYEGPKPAWFRDEYATNCPGDEPRTLEPEELKLTGGNMVLRRDLLEALGGFQPALGMAGRRISYGEESALFAAMGRQMPDQVQYYSPRLWVRHLVPERKMRWPWLFRSHFTTGMTQYSIRPAYRRSLPSGRVRGRLRLAWLMARQVLVVLWHILRAFAARDREAYPRAGNYLYEIVLLRKVRRLGQMWAAMLGRPLLATARTPGRTPPKEESL